MEEIGCISCQACVPCTQGINVPRIFEIYNDGVMYNDWETAQTAYTEEGHLILRCTQCGTCTVSCEQEIPIPDVLEEIRPKLQKG